MKKRILVVIFLITLLSTGLIDVLSSTHKTEKTKTNIEAKAQPGKIPNPDQKPFSVSVSVPSDRTVKWRLTLSYFLELYYSAGAEHFSAKIKLYKSDGSELFSDSISVDNAQVGGRKSRSRSNSWSGDVKDVSEICFNGYVKAEADGYVSSDYALSRVNNIKLTAEWPDKVKVEASSGGTTNPKPGMYEVWKEEFSVTANPDPGCVFDHWEVTGGIKVIESGNNGKFKVMGDGTIKPVFKCDGNPPCKTILHVKSSPITGAKITYSGDYSGEKNTNFDIECETGCAFTVTLEAPDEVNKNGEKYVFDHWEGKKYSSSNTVTVSLEKCEEATETAVYKKSGDGDGGNKYEITVKAVDENGNTIQVRVRYSFDNNLWRTRYTPFTIRKDKKFYIWLEVPENASGRSFKYWQVTGHNPQYDRKIRVYVYKKKTATAVYTGGGSNNNEIIVDVYPSSLRGNEFKYIKQVQGAVSWKTGRFKATFEVDGNSWKFKSFNISGYVFRYWMKNGHILTTDPVTPWIDEACNLTAVYEAQNGTYIKIDSLSVTIYPANYTGFTTRYGKANRLFRGEWFVAELNIKASSNTASGSGGSAELKITVPEASWYVLCDNGLQRGGKYTQTIIIDSEGEKIVYIPVEPKTWQSIKVGIWTFKVSYEWSNGDASGSGEARTTVMVSDHTGPDLSGMGGSKGTYTLLYWLPVTTDQAYIIVVPYWPDKKPIRYREWLSVKSFLKPRLVYKSWEVWLKACRWDFIKGNFTIYTGTKIFRNLKLDNDIAVFYNKVNIQDLSIEGLSADAELKFKDWFPSRQIRVAELTTPIYNLKWDSSKVMGRIKIIDWSKTRPLSEGWIIILVRNLETGQLHEEWFYATPYANFQVNIPEKYEVWSIAIAPAKNEIYLNNKYAKIILVKK